MVATTTLQLSIVRIGLETATAGTKIMLTMIHVTMAAALVPMLRGAPPPANNFPVPGKDLLS
jgi:hypothetical protein